METFKENEKKLAQYYKDSGAMFSGEDEEVWVVGNIKVYFKGILNSGGTILASHYVDYIKNRWPERKFKVGYEIGCGPGFIGFSLLASGLIEKLILSDIEPSCSSFVQKTIEQNNLQDKVSFFLSDALTAIPDHLKFDIVVSNPPWKYEMTDDVLAGHQPGVAKIHRLDENMGFAKSFFSTIRGFLNPGSPILWACGCPLHKDFCRFPGCPVTERKAPPILDLVPIAEEGGLFVREVAHPYNSLWSFWLFVVENPVIDIKHAAVI